MRSRREFLQAAGVLGVETVLGPRVRLLASAGAAPARKHGKNDTIQIALIGAGGQGMYDTSVALEVEGTKLVAVADCYDGRLTHSKERWGQELFTTRDYREILAREDVDAVIVGTPDHWHKDVAIDAMRAGKDVYCEKPMIHVYEDGPAMIAAQSARAAITTSCSAFLVNLNADTALSKCTAVALAPVAAFNPSTAAAKPGISATLNSLCSADACTSSGLSQQHRQFASQCANDFGNPAIVVRPGLALI